MDSQMANTDLQTSSKTKKTRRREKKPTTTSSIQNSSNLHEENNCQYSTSLYNDFGPTFVHQTSSPFQWYNSPYFAPSFPHQIHHQQFGSINHMLPHVLPSQSNQKPPISNHYGQNPFGENHFQIPPAHNAIPTTFYNNQNPQIPKPPASMTLGMLSQSQVGTFPTNLESITPRYGSSNSSIFPSPNFSTSEVIDHRRQGLNHNGYMSAFHPYQKPQHAWEASEMFTPHNPNYEPSRNEVTSTIDSFNITNSLPNINKLIELQENEQKVVTPVTLENYQTDNTKLEPASVVEEKYDFSCVICQDNKKDTVLLPCRHLCVCQKCSENFELCPLCRKKVTESMTVFI